MLHYRKAHVLHIGPSTRRISRKKVMAMQPLESEPSIVRGIASNGRFLSEIYRRVKSKYLPGCIVDGSDGFIRYCNMDYLVFSSLQSADRLPLVLSYDISCQYSKRVWSRMNKLPPSLHIRQTPADVTFLVPKFHLPAHIETCQSTFSFNLEPGVGRTDGEGIERNWAGTNPLATSTREMGPRSRRDTLDDHFGDNN
jgi:hypothetical protein